ncbi:unnamed protein product, partial [Rotaria sp. Silwood2]
QNQLPQPQLSHYLINLHSWKLTHQPHEPTLHWNYRFRQQQHLEIDLEEDQSSEYWDWWFEQNQSTILLPFSENQVYCPKILNFPSISKRQREFSLSLEISNKREKSSHFELKLPKRIWSNTNYGEHLIKSRYYHFNFHIISYNILAQKLIENNLFLYDDCLEDKAKWNRRKERLLK